MKRISFNSILIVTYFILYSNNIFAIETISNKNNNYDYTIGVCSLVENPPIPIDTAANAISPRGQTSVYLRTKEKIKLDWSHWAVKLLSSPKYGKLESKDSANFRYIPTVENYYGSDKAILRVEIGKLRTKVIYHFKVMRSVGGTSGYDPYVEHCPKGIVWKI